MRFVAIALALCLGQDATLPQELADLLGPAASLDPDDRETARTAIERRVPPQRDMLKKLAKSDPRALIILGLAGEQGVRANLIGLLKSDDAAVRSAAAQAMVYAPGDGGLDTLASHLDDTDLATAMACARALSRMKKGGIAELRRSRGSKDERKARIAAYGIELAEGGELANIQRSMKDELGYVIAANTQSVIDAANHVFTKEGKREDPFKETCEKGDLSEVARDALGTFRIRAGCIDPSGALDLVKWPATKPTPWALVRAPKLKQLHRSCAAYQLVKQIEERATTKSPKEDEIRHVDALELALQQACGIAKPDGELDARAKKYREWYDRAWTAIVDTDVVRAIDDGVAWLRPFQEKDGSWTYCHCGWETWSKHNFPVGVTSLVGYTLLKMDVPVDDPAITKAVTNVLDIPVAAVTNDPTYCLSLEAMFLSEYLQQAKGKKGDRKTKVEPAAVPRALKRIQECVDWLIEARITIETGGYESYVWTYNKPTGTDTKTHDHSNTQFAALGLAAGQNAGAKVPPKIWQGALNHWKGAQYKEGGWYYTPLPADAKETSKVGSTSMTGAGLTGLLISEAAFKREPTEKIAQSDEAVKRAIAKWEKTYPIQAPVRYGQVGHVFSIYYDLYSIERAMMLAGLARIGTRDWYHDGALYILWNQRHDGAWIDVTDTCLALLFLKKAYVSVATGDPRKDDK